MSICTHGMFTIYECKPNSPLQCAECSEPFLDVHLLEEHICELHLDCWVPYKCVICLPQQHFTTELVLKMHMKYIHGTNKPIITYLSSEEKREKLHHLLVRSLIRSGTSHSAIQSRWQADPTPAASHVALRNARPTPAPSQQMVHFAPSTSLVRSGVGVSGQPSGTVSKWQPDLAPAALVAVPRPRPRSRPTSYVEEPIVHSAPSSNSAGTAEQMYSSRIVAPLHQAARMNRARMQPFTTNITTYVPAGVTSATVDTTYRIGPRPMFRESSDMLTSSRSRARTISPPPSSHRNPQDRSLDEQIMISTRSRNDGDPFQATNSARSRREYQERMGGQLMPSGQHKNRSLIGKVDFPQSWNEPPRMVNSISMDNLGLHLKTDSETMKSMCYRITVTEKMEERGETRRYDLGPSSTPV